MIDGVKNRVVQVDSVPDDEEVGSATNFYGNGFKTVKTPFPTSKQAVADYDASKARCWVIENPNKKHYATGGNIGYKIGECTVEVIDLALTSACKDMPPLLAKKGSLAWNRAPFARHNVSDTLQW
jgi:primary-amine oxidase